MTRSFSSHAGVFAFLLLSASAALAQNNLCDEPGEAPDLIGGAIYAVGRHGTLGGITAYSIGTDSCNIGTCWADWFPDTPEHPVIGQNMFRLEAGRFEQIGQSWVKHGFGALNNDLCGSCLEADGTHLGVNCSDPYGWTTNGNQARLGPKSEVDPSTGEHLHPYTAMGWNGSLIYKRLQVHNTDLDPALNPGALYFVEAQYVAADDAASGNNFNNISYRQVAVSGSGSTFTLSFVGETIQQTPAIAAWAAHEASVRLSAIGGEYAGAAQATALGAGDWRYEYALQNLVSHDGAQSLRIPIPHGAIPTNVGFHDVDYHSGEPWAGADWTVAVDTASDPNAIVWSTQTFLQNPNANALRWGTLYNFRFDLRSPPVDGSATVASFRNDGKSHVWQTLAPDRCGDAFCDAGESHEDCPADCGLDPSSGAIAVASLRLEREPDGDLALAWNDSCVPNDHDYEVYEGRLGEFSSHYPLLCTTGGGGFATITPLSTFDTYYLVVPTNGSREGSYGRESSGADRPQSQFACLPQAVQGCR